MKLLVVAFSDSVHTARWLSQINDQKWQIYLMSSNDSGHLHKQISNVTFLSPFQLFKNLRSYKQLYKLFRILMEKMDTEYLEKRLNKYIMKLKPDIIHSLETQAAGYLVLSVRKKYYQPDKFPTWRHTNWGSDIYLFGRLDEHKPKINEVLNNCDFYSCECKRDMELADEYGFTDFKLPIIPNAGGFDIAQLLSLKKESKITSKRKMIMLKGYQGWAGRALVGLRALSRCMDLLDGYTLIIYASGNAIDIKIAAELFSKDTGVNYCILPVETEHLEILKYHMSARVSIGLSISDAISTSLLEAMAMGSFPIQSWTSAADEWIMDGVTGLLVPPEDPEIVEIAIRKALLDDELVDSAANENWQTVVKRLDYEQIKKKAIESYKTVYNYSLKNRRS